MALKVECDLCKSVVDIGDAVGPGVPIRGNPQWGASEIVQLQPNGRPTPIYLYTMMQTDDRDHDFSYCRACLLDGMEKALQLAGRLPKREPDPDPTVVSPVSDTGRTGGDPDVQPMPIASDVQATGTDDDTEVAPTTEQLERHIASFSAAPGRGRVVGRQHDHHGQLYRRRSNGTCAHCAPSWRWCRPSEEIKPLPPIRDLGGGPGENGGSEG